MPLTLSFFTPDCKYFSRVIAGFKGIYPDKSHQKWFQNPVSPLNEAGFRIYLRFN